MTFPKAENYRQSPLYDKTMQNFQSGNWNEGFALLNDLTQQYPLEHELRNLRAEMQIRASIDQYESQEIQHERFQKFIGLGIRLLGLVFIIGLVYLGLRFSSSWIQEQWLVAREKVEDDVQLIEISAQFRNAQNLMQAGEPIEAKILFEEIQSFDPNYPNIDFYLDQAREMAELESHYTEAVEYSENGDLATAYQKFQAIYEQDPFYKDVSLQIDKIEQDFLLDDIFSEAETAYQAGNWEEAIRGFDELRNMDPKYREIEVEHHLFDSYVEAAKASLTDPAQTLEALALAEEYFSKALALRPQNEAILAARAESRQTVEDRLVNGYLSAAQAAVVEQPDSLDTLQLVQEYFGKALALRPNDPQIQKQYALVDQYLNAIESYNRGLWSEAIDELELLYAEDPTYANNTISQALYDAYLTRGKELNLTGEYLEALSDFQRAVIIAQQNPDSPMRLFEGQLMVAYTLGQMRNYADAVTIYQSVLESDVMKNSTLVSDPNVANIIAEAERMAASGDYRGSYLFYREVLRDIDGMYKIVAHTLKTGDYLFMLARRYNSTVQIILQVNNIVNPNDIYVGQVLLIPTLP